MDSAPAMTQTPPLSDRQTQLTQALFRALLLAGMVLLSLKLFLASRLDLYSDEIFYWLASTRLALAYSDLPFMTSLLVWLGTQGETASPLAVRSLFLAMGSCLPLLLYWLALPIRGPLHAVAAAWLSLCIPLGGFLGLLAVPDVPLIVFGLLSVGLFERALRDNLWRHWLLLGACVALGLATHYRFILYPAGALLFLMLPGAARVQWRNPRLYVALLIACLGLLPILWFNLSNQMASASFYLVERHPWEFRSAGLLHAVLQAGVVTPPLYALLLVTLWRMWRLARRGSEPARLLLCVALVNLLVYLLLAPWTDPTSTTLHWPLSAYFPILVFVPGTLILLFNHLRERLGAARAWWLTLAIPALGFLGSFAALLGVGSQAYQEPVQRLLGRGVLSNKMAGWEEFAAYSRNVLAFSFGDENPLIVTDNYYTAAQLGFAGVSDQPMTLDSSKAVRDGRSVQLNLWGMDREAVIARAGEPFMFVMEDSSLNILEGIDTVASACDLSRDLRRIDRLSLFGGDKQFTFFRGELIDPADERGYPADPCPLPPRAWIDAPVAGQTLSGEFRVEGWAFNEDIGIRSVSLLLNGRLMEEIPYGISRPDVASSQNVRTDPNSPNLGFAFSFDTGSVANGHYFLEIGLTDERGMQSRYGRRPVRIQN